MTEPSPSSVWARLRRICSHPHAPHAIFALSFLMLVPSLDTGLSADDWIHSMVARGSTELEGFRHDPMDLFYFAGGASTRALQEDGVLAWWDDREARLAFLRPVSALTHRIDWALWPDAPWLMHLHSIAWGMIALAGVWTILRRFSGATWIAVLAFAFYALEDGRSWFGAWVAARNGVVATAVSIWVVLLHHLHRAEKKRLAGVLGPVVLLAGLLGGEGALAITGYLFAYAVFLDRAPLHERLLSLVPYAIVVVGWRAVYDVLGYGAARSGLYFDPGDDPLGFLFAAIERAPISFLSDVFGPWSDVYTTLFPFPRVQLALWLAGVGSFVWLGWVIGPLLRTDPLARFGALGAGLALLPASAPFLSDRLLTWFGLGSSIVMAALVAAWIERREVLLGSPARRLFVPPLVVWLVVSNLVLDPLMYPSRSRGNETIKAVLERGDRGVPRDPSIRERVLVYVNPPSVPLAAYTPILRAATGVPRAKTQRWLATAVTELEVARPDAHTLELRPRGGFLLDPGSWLLRDPRRPVDDVVTLSGVTFTTTARTADGRPATVRARFDRPLDDPQFLWLEWRDDRFVPFALPAVGGKVVLPQADYFRVWLGDAVSMPFPAKVDPPEG